MSSAVYLWKTFRAQAEQHSGVSQKVFGFSPESMFALRPECCSESARNPVRLHPGMLFAFRHTFALDMMRAGISLPALMQLMGHAQIQTTLVYLHITPQDVWEQYARAIARHIRPVPPLKP